MTHKGMKFGIFLAPVHRIGENPTLSLDRDMELIEWLDYLGYDEVWVGEHHSAGWELIAAPDVFIAAVAERTRHIRLGSGVTSLPYHHPLMVANRFVQLDHMTRGRTMLGCGPGALVSDAYMLGIEPVMQRPRVRQGPLPRDRVGESRGHPAQLRAVRAVRDAALPGLAPHPRELQRVG